MKKLLDYSWNVSEEEYRAYPCLSYSLLSSYTKEGFSAIENLEHKETKSMFFGSLVDTMLTRLKDFDSIYYILDTKLDDKVMNVCGYLYNKTNFEDYKDIPEEYYVETFCYLPANYKEETKFDKIKKILEKHYDTYVLYKDKLLVDPTDYADAQECTKALKTLLAKKYYTHKDVMFNFQYKFKTILNDIEYKCMFDCIVVDYKTKTIHPIDIKTTSRPEYDFAKSFIDFNYHYQARLYVRILSSILTDTEYGDFTIEPMNFLVINRKRLKPLFFKFNQSFAKGDLQLGNTLVKDPEDVGKELTILLKEKRELPIGINEDDDNDLKKIIETYESKN